MQKTSNWKEYLNTVLLAVVSYLIIDMHLTFKSVVKDVQELKVDVEKHDYILNIEKNKNKKNNSLSIHLEEAILPNNKVKIEKEKQRIA